MKVKITAQFFTLYIFGIVSLSAFAAVEAPYEVGTWGDFAQGALSLTFDDWPTSGATRITTDGRTAFNAKNLHFTMFINTDGISSSNWSVLKTTFADGHEVASHNQQHNSNTSGLGPSQTAIKTNVPGEKCVSIAYPNCTPISQTEVLKYYLVGRTCASDQINNKTPSNFTQIQSKGFGAGSGGYPNDANSMNNYANSAASQKGWGVELHHGIGGDSHSWATTNLDAMKSHLDYLDKNRSKIWTETFGNVARYIKERDAVSVAKKDSTANGITISVTDNLPDSIYNFPLSIRRPLPATWTTAVVMQKGSAVKDTVITDGTTKYVMFKAVPDGGDVVISEVPVGVLRGGGSSVGSEGSFPAVRNNATLVIDSRRFNGSALTVTLFDLCGKTLARYTLGPAENRVTLPANTIHRSAFIAKITGGNKSCVGKFMLQL
jgi:hypothetical protein